MPLTFARGILTCVCWTNSIYLVGVKMISQKKRLSGEEGRSSGLEYETSLVKKFGGKTFSSKKVKSICRELTTRKADIEINNTIISVKNPKLSSTSTQVQVCPYSTFKCYFPDIPSNVEYSLRSFIGDFADNHKGKENKDHFFMLCEIVGIEDPQNTLSSEELRRVRLDSFSLGKDNCDAVVEWLYENREGIYRFIFQDGVMDPSLERPTKLWWSHKKNDLTNISKFDMSDILQRARNMDKSEVRFRDEGGKGKSKKAKNAGTVIQVGAITIQMKGSGSGSAYHNLQFNCSLNDLNNFMK